MTQKFKVGDKVRIISKGYEPLAGFENGDIVTVLEVACRRGETRFEVQHEDGTIGYGGNATFEKVSDKPTKNQRITALESEVEALKAEVSALKLGGTITHKVTITQEKEQTPNERRKAIIDEAKAFVEDAKQEFHGEQRYIVNSYVCDAEFIVNKEKRAVTALIYHHSPAMKERGISRDLKAKAIAKCAPDDVFNADIGKAIALGRALGLGVSKFEQAVKPTEVVVGMVVQSIERHTNRVRFTHTVNEAEDKTFITRALTGDDGYSYAKILDDTEAKY